MDLRIDYSKSGLDVKQAMLDHCRRFPDKARRPDHIVWDGHEVRTVDWFAVPGQGTVRFEFISALESIEQGIDAKLDGWFELAQKERIPVLRTWKDDRYENVVEYEYLSRDRRMGIWNVYREGLPNGQMREDHWSGNAGCWVEKVRENERIYHCSPGMLNPPDFEALIFRVTICPSS